MKTWKLVSGIISCVLTAMVLFQSCAASVGEALSESTSVDGAAGFLVALLMLAGGIVSIATCKSASKGGNIAMIVLFFLAALIGFGNSGYFKDLAIWSVWCVVCGVFAIIALVLTKRR